jgi:hypothetical protein
MAEGRGGLIGGRYMTHSVHTVLAGHHDNRTYFRERVEVTLTQEADGGIAITYIISDISSDIRVPTPDTPAPEGALWQTTCCELFVNPVEQTGYREFNFSPSGQWAAHDFLDIRKPAPTAPNCATPEIKAKREKSRLQLDVKLPKSAFPRAASLRLAVNVILQANDGTLAYWALTHPPGKPDFHHHAGFVLNLGPMGFRPTRWP